MKVKSESEVAQSCQTLCDSMDCSPPGSSTHGISQARVLEWGAIAISVLGLSERKSWLIGKDSDAEGGLGVGGEGDDRGWDGWMATLTQWTWVWASSGSWWWTGRPGVLQSLGSQSWTRLSNWTELNYHTWIFLFISEVSFRCQWAAMLRQCKSHVLMIFC